MVLKITPLVLHSINHRKLWLLFFFSLFFVLTAEATEYIVSPAPGDEFGVSVNGEEVTVARDFTVYWQLLLWLALLHVLSVIDTLLYPVKLIFAILGFRIVDRVNLLDNPNRSSIYAYIKKKPGVYIGEIADNTGLNRGTLRHHLKILKLENMIEAHCDRGKVRYFQSNSTSEEEKQIILALQNEMIRMIICNILEEECNTNKDLVQATGISKGTITWYMKQLKELDLIEENKVGRARTYSINPAYQDIIKKHT